MKIGFIGAGKMAQAIISGLDKEKFEVYISSRDFEKTSIIAKNLGVNQAKDNIELSKSVDVVIMSVKPQVMPKVLTEVKDYLEGKLMLSIAAGLTLENLADLTSKQLEIVRIMPNINATIKESTTAICPNELVADNNLEIAKEIFSSIGQIFQIEEKDFSTFSAIAGSSPAFIYIFIDALSRAGVLHGMPKDLATEIVASTVSASANMLAQSGENPWSLVDKVSSPGGTTVEGVVSLEENKFVASVIDAVTKTIEKDKRL